MHNEQISLMLDGLFFISTGITATIQLLAGGILIGLICGTFIAILRYLRICKRILNNIISILRGTPVILQLSIIYFSSYHLLGIKLDVITAGILTFGLNSSAYIAEILRAGIENLPKGQFEAAQSLKIPKFYTWKDIVLPQVIRNILPALTGEVIALLKETALIATIGGMDIMRAAQIFEAERFDYFIPLCIAGLYYYTLVLFIEYLGKKLEKISND